MPIPRRLLGAAPLALLARPFLARPAAAQEAYPGTRPVTIVVGYAAGGSTDTGARLLARELSRETGGTFVVDNRVGASGTLGSASVARARPDGHTLLFAGSGTWSMSGFLFPNRGYDEEASFAPVGTMTTSSLFVCTSPKTGIPDVRAFVARAREMPGRMHYASSGAGSSAHVATELFLGDAGIRVENVTYRGGAPAMQAAVSGEVELAFVEAVSALGLIRSGDLLPLAVTSAERSPLAPAVPTLSETVTPGYECTTTSALFAPAGTPDPVIRLLHAGMVRAMGQAEIVAQLRHTAVFPSLRGPEELKAYQAEERRKWGAVIRDRGIAL